MHRWIRSLTFYSFQKGPKVHSRTGQQCGRTTSPSTKHNLDLHPRAVKLHQRENEQGVGEGGHILHKLWPHTKQLDYHTANRLETSQQHIMTGKKSYLTTSDGSVNKG